MPQISVIVPIYNVEKYLPQCLDSLVSQTLKDIEIICINDGSPDNCLQILQDYAAKDSRIKIIDKQNEGLSCARNDALNLVSAPYIAFVDSDDWIEPETFSVLINIMQKEKADLINFDYFLCHDDGRMFYHKSFPEKCPDGLKISVADTIPDMAFNVWNKLFRTDIIKKNQILFPAGLHFEDVPFHLKYMCSINNVFIIEKALYNYRQRDDSIMGISRKKQKHTHIYDRILGMENLYLYLDEHKLFEKHQALFSRHFMQAVRHDLDECARDLQPLVWQEAKRVAAIVNQNKNISEFTDFLAGKYHKIFDLGMPSIRQKLFSIRKQGKRLIISVLGIKIRKNLK